MLFTFLLIAVLSRDTSLLQRYYDQKQYGVAVAEGRLVTSVSAHRVLVMIHWCHDTM